MPRSLHVRLTRAVSVPPIVPGVSIELVAVLEASVLARPHELHATIREMFEASERALAHCVPPPTPPGDPDPPRALSKPGRPHDDDDDGDGRRFPGRDECRPHRRPAAAAAATAGRNDPMTDDLRRTINAIATRLAVDPHEQAAAIIGVDLTHLSVAQASELIDYLKGLS